MKTIIKTLIKKNYKMALVAVAAFALGAILLPGETEEVTPVVDSISVSAKSDTINVSEADRNETRINAYKNNVTVKYNGKVVDLSNGSIEGDFYIANGYIVSFTEKDEKIVASVRYGELSGAASFGINVHQLINDENGNTVYNSPSYGYMFDEEGNQKNNGHIPNHEQDLDEKGNVIGVQDETKVKMTESQEVSSKPSTGSAETVEKKEEYIPSKDVEEVTKPSTGASMENVEVTVEEEVSNPTADYRQVTIANANGNNDGTTINAVSTNGGSEMLTVYCVSRTGDTLNCVTSDGGDLTITISVDESGAMTFVGINGIYR